MLAHLTRVGMRRPNSTVQVLPELRAKQAEHLAERPDVTGLFYGIKWDMRDGDVPNNAHAVSIWKACLGVALYAQSAVEVPEPLWLRELPRTAVVALSAKLGGVIRRKPVRVVSYAIENAEFAELVGNVPCHRFVRLVLGAFLKLYLRYAVDFVVFGTPGAQKAYAAIRPGTERYPVILELPASRGAETRSRQGLVFLGETSLARVLMWLCHHGNCSKWNIPMPSSRSRGRDPLTTPLPSGVVPIHVSAASWVSFRIKRRSS